MRNEVEEIKTPEQYLPEEQTKEISRELSQVIEISKSITVTSEVKMEEANGIAGKIRARQKGLEAFRLAIVKPFKTHIASIEKFFKDKQNDFAEPLERIEKKILNYRESRKQPLEKSTYQSGVGMTTFVKDVEIEIKDREQIPDNFWVVDESYLKRAAKEFINMMKPGETTLNAIPGVSVKCIERPSYKGEK